jgi:hypothetical protein
MMDTTKRNWVDSTYEAIFTVERYLGIKGDCQGVKDFSTLANWIYTTNAFPYSFMPERWEKAKETAQSFASFLQTLHRSMLEDGHLIFVEVPGGQSFMILNAMPEDTDFIQQDFERRNPFTPAKRYEVHTDVARFIEKAEWYESLGAEIQAQNEAVTA